MHVIKAEEGMQAELAEFARDPAQAARQEPPAPKGVGDQATPH
jgi:hypothetical protein